MLGRSVPARGFTLLEIMLVLVLIGLMLSTVIPTLRRDNPPDQVNTLAEKLLANVRQLQRQAQVSGQNLGLQLTDDGYRLVQYQDNRWQATDQAPTPVPADLRLTIKVGESVWQEAMLLEQQSAIVLAPRASADTGEAVDALTEEPGEEEEAVIVPDIIFWAAGDVTPARLTLASRGNPATARTLVFDENGQIRFASGDER